MEGWTMTEFEAEMRRLSELDMAVRNYLSHLYAFEQGAEHDETPMMYWRDQLDELTSDETFEYETVGGRRFRADGTEVF